MGFEFFQSLAQGDSKLEIPAMGLQLAVRLPQSVSGGVLTVLETVNAPRFGPPLHRHHETEVFRVFEGRYLYEVDGRKFYAVAFFGGLGKLMAAGRPDMPTLNAFGGTLGVEFLGPPIHEAS